MSTKRHAQACCYSKFKMAARSGDFTKTLHANRYSLFMLVLSNFFFCVKNSVFNLHKTKAHSGQEMRDLMRYEGQKRPTLQSRLELQCFTRETTQLLELVLMSSCSFSRMILPVEKHPEYFCLTCKFNTVISLTLHVML